jgi:TonB family protein
MGNRCMGKSALPSLAASVLLHVALPLGIGGRVLSVSRASLLPSKATELELVPMDSSSLAEVSLAALATGSRKLPLLAERAAPPRRSVAPVLPAPVLPTPLMPAPTRALSAGESRAAALPSAESEAAPESTESAVVAAPVSVVEPSVAAPSSVVEPRSTPPSFGTAAGAALAASGALVRRVADPAEGASSSLGGTASDDSARALRAAYLQELRRRVLGHRVYPYLARRARLEGTVCLRVSLNGRGEVARLEATCAAPQALLEAAFAAVRTAAPFGPLPSQLRELTLDLPMVFQLETP